MLLSTLGTSLLGIPLTGKVVKRWEMPGRGVMPAAKSTIRAGEGTIRAGLDF